MLVTNSNICLTISRSDPFPTLHVLIAFICTCVFSVHLKMDSFNNINLTTREREQVPCFGVSVCRGIVRIH